MKVTLGVAQGRRQLIKKDGTNSRDVLAPGMSALESPYQDLMHLRPLDGYIIFLGSKLERMIFLIKRMNHDHTYANLGMFKYTHMTM